MEYDMYVSDNILKVMDENLQRIMKTLQSASEEMNSSVQRSSTFLAGNQFERTKENTKQCLNKIEIIGMNLQYARKYLAELESLLEAYGDCGYSEEMS